MTHVNKTVINDTYVNNSFQKNVNASRTSFNGGNGGIKAEPNAEQRAAAANAKRIPPTEQQLSRQQLASKDQNLRASANKGKPNTDAIKSFDKNNGVAAGKGGEQGLGAAGGAAGAGKGENRSPGAGVERAGNKPGNVTERNLKGAGNAGEGGNKFKTGNQGNKVGAGNRTNNQRNLQGNQAKMHSGKTGGTGGGAGHGPRQMTARSGQPKMATHGPQMGGKHPQMGGGGNRPKPSGGQQQQGKKKPGQR